MRENTPPEKVIECVELEEEEHDKEHVEEILDSDKEEAKDRDSGLESEDESDLPEILPS